MISAAAASLSVFARAGDRLWTPAPVDPARVVTPVDLARISGPLDPASTSARPLQQPPLPLAGEGEGVGVRKGEGEGEILAWGETDEVARLRSTPASDAPLGDWREAVWTQFPSVEAARRCNHRGFGHELARERGVALPGARLIASRDELDAHVASGGAAESASGTWIVKAPYSAAGRERLRCRTGEPMTDDVRTRLGRLLARGPCVFEPWVDRIAEVATAGIIGAGEHLLLPTHGLETDAAGVFRAIGIGAELGLTDAELATVRATAEACANALARAGYRGPFGVDAYVYRAPDGTRRLAALGEINARLTFGHVAHAHAARLGAPARFVLGRGTPPPAAVPIVLPADGDPTAVWIEPFDSRPARARDAAQGDRI